MHHTVLNCRGMSPVSESAEGHAASASGQNSKPEDQDASPVQEKTQAHPSSSDDPKYVLVVNPQHFAHSVTAYCRLHLYSFS